MIALNEIVRRLSNWIRNVVLTTPQKDGKTVYIAQVTSFGATMETQIIYPYGHYACAPKGSQGITLQVLGQPENLITIPYDMYTAFKGYAAGEVVIGNPVHKNRVEFLNTGAINILTPLGDIIVTATKGKAVVKVHGAISIESETSTIDIKANQDISVKSTTGKVTVEAQSDVVVKSTAGTATVDALNAITISSTAASVTLESAGATLTLSASGLVSNVPISAPGITMTLGGNANMAGGAIIGASEVTAGSVALTTHTHGAGSYTNSAGAVSGDSGVPL